VSLRVFRRFLTDGLEHSQLPNGRILVRYQAIDTFLEGFQAKDETKQMAEELVESLAE
jgi:hypothetical protein